jgi:hypothetical protein
MVKPTEVAVVVEVLLEAVLLEFQAVEVQE